MNYIRYFLFACLFIITVLVWDFFPSEQVKFESENRMSAPFPKFFVNKTFNQEVGTEIDNYLKDYFPKRSDIIKMHFDALYTINRRVENSRAIMGDDGWVFSKVHLDGQQRNHTSEMLQKLSTSLSHLNNVLKKHNVKLYVLIIPNKVFVYREHLSKYMNVNKITDTAVSVVDYLSKHNPDISIIYPVQKMYDERHRYTYPLYPKRDHHLAGYGNYIVYRELMTEILKDFNDVHCLSLNELSEKSDYYKIGYEARELGFTQKVLGPPQLKPQKNFKYKESQVLPTIFTTDENKYKVFWIGTSMGDGLSPLMSGSFHQVLLWKNSWKREKNFRILDLLRSEKMDILIFDVPVETLGNGGFYERINDILEGYEEVQ